MSQSRKTELILKISFWNPPTHQVQKRHGVARDRRIHTQVAQGAKLCSLSCHKKIALRALIFSFARFFNGVSMFTFLRYNVRC